MPLNKYRESFGGRKVPHVRMYGAGLICDDDVVKMEKENTRPGFPGEKHGVSLCSRVRYNFLGPGTQIDKRLTRGDKPINDLDLFSKEHDMAYNQISKDLKAKRLTQPEYISRVKLADEIFKEKASKSKDAPILGRIASKAILAKEIGEDLGVLSRKTFSGGSNKIILKKEIKPADRLKQKVMQELKRNKKGLVIIKPDQEEEQEGGFLPALGVALLSGLASTALDKLINHFFDKKGSGITFPTTKKDKIKLLVENVPEQELLKVVRNIR